MPKGDDFAGHTVPGFDLKEARGKRSERRCNQRMRKQLRVRLWQGKRELRGSTEDISNRGLFVIGPHRFEATWRLIPSTLGSLPKRRCHNP